MAGGGTWQATMSKKSYEHQAVEADSSAELIEQTAELGRAGWELVSVVYDPSAAKYVAFLKKKVRHGKRHHHDDDEGHEEGR